MKTMSLLITTLFSLFAYVGCQKPPINMDYTNTVDTNKMLIVITPPSINNNYYAAVYDQIVAFDIAYAKQIMGKDNVVVVADKATKKYLEKHLPADILLEQKLEDIWLRDCSTVNPYAPFQFRYAAAAQGNQADADYVQNKFNAFANANGIYYNQSSLILDGGNYVDNYHGRAIVSDRFLTDNNLSYNAGVQQLKQLLQLDEVAIIPNDDPTGLAHADGQVMWVDENTVFVTDYQDSVFQKSIQDELEYAFPGVQVLLMPTAFDTVVWDPNFGSSCGIHINSCITKDYIYFPIFNKNTDATALQLVKDNTAKTVIPIDASNVCMMGGSVRCLSWQLTGDNATRLIEAARE